MIKTLLVEDNSRFRKIFKEELNEWFSSMVVEEAQNGREAMEKAESLCPTLVFMDITLPDESGLNLTEKVREICPDTTVVVLTSYDLSEYQQAAMRHGASHYFVKGTSTRNEIKAWIESFLNNSKGRTYKELLSNLDAPSLSLPLQ